MIAPDRSLCGRILLHAGVEPLYCPELSIEQRRAKEKNGIERQVIDRAVRYALFRGYCDAGDVVIAAHLEYNSAGESRQVLRFLHAPGSFDSPIP